MQQEINYKITYTTNKRDKAGIYSDEQKLVLLKMIFNFFKCVQMKIK